MKGGGDVHETTNQHTKRDLLHAIFLRRRLWCHRLGEASMRIGRNGERMALRHLELGEELLNKGGTGKIQLPVPTVPIDIKTDKVVSRLGRDLNIHGQGINKVGTLLRVSAHDKTIINPESCQSSDASCNADVEAWVHRGPLQAKGGEEIMEKFVPLSRGLNETIKTFRRRQT